MRFSAIDWAVVVVYFGLTLAVGLLDRPAGRSQLGRVLSLRPLDALVVAGALDGGHHLLDRHTQPGDRHHPHRRRGRQLGVVGLSLDRHADRLCLRPAVAPLGSADRHRVLRAPLQRPCRRLPARLPGDLPRGLLQRHGHGRGHTGGDQDRRCDVRAVAAPDHRRGLGGDGDLQRCRRLPRRR